MPNKISSDSCDSLSSDDVPPRKQKKKNSSGSSDFCVQNIYLNRFGRNEINVAEKEMPGLMALRRHFTEDKPLKGAKIIGCTPITAPIAVLIETLHSLGADLRWCANNLYATQNDVAAALAESGFPIYGWYRETVEEFFWCIKKCFEIENWEPNMILDDGGEATTFCRTRYLNSFRSLTGIVERSMISINRLNGLLRSEILFAPVININNSVTNTKFENRYSCRESIIINLMKCTNLMLGGKQVVLCGYGEVGKGCCQSLKGLGCIIYITESDPICALQACMDGFKVVDLNVVIGQVDIVITATGNINVVTREYMNKMKSGCILYCMSHTIDEIDVDSLHDNELNWEHVSSHHDRIHWSDGKTMTLLTRGNLNYTRSKIPSVVTSMTASTQILALIELYNAPTGLYPAGIYSLPKKMDEYVASLHLTTFDAHLTELTAAQAKHMGISINGPFKPDYYRY